ncbi:LysR family transcriptional regulator substrate-binding protein, partial [Agrococcus sp. HG114]|uniref:LysR family transcriptional regulator substrate-binding protein n=1 Tax=Agrococcus sp. HG114 TaxID=2969757 RepID=UPI00215AB4BB
MQRFRLGGVPGVTPAKWMRVWAQRVPEVPIELVALDEADAVRALEDGRVDAVLARLPVPGEGLHQVPLYDELPVVVAPVGHPIVAFDEVALADLAGEPMLEAGDLSAAQLLEVVATGAGLAIVPMSVARALGGTGTRHRVVTDAPSTTIALVWLERADSALHQELIGIAKGRRAGSSRGRDREHRVEPGNAATGAKPRPSKPKPTPPASRPRRRGGHG